MTTTDPRVERLALALALTLHMMQLGTPLSLLQQQLIMLRGALQDILDAEDLSHATYIHTPQPIPESVAEALAEDFVIPDDPSGCED